MADPNARDLKLIQYLNEAYGTEKRLETALEAHIAMTTRDPYRKRLQEHLRETKRHAKDVERRIKKLGGSAETVSLPGPDAATGVAQVAQTVVNKAAAAAQGPAHMLRGTGEAEKMLKNAKTEYQSEAEEIAHYNAIEALATSVGDKETAQLAKTHRREEERMASFLGKLIPQLTKAVATQEIPASERNGGRRRSSSRRRSAGAGRSSASSRSTARSASRSASSRASGGTTKRATAKRGTAKRATAARATAKRATKAKRATASRSTAKRSTAKRSTAKRSTAKRASGSGSRARAGSRARSR